MAELQMDKFDDIKVSIVCNAYNHEPYIRDALEGFVMQKTNFAFEVLIHDDASTDKTADIIREYEAKYPEIIKPIYQTENQYTKGGVSRFQAPRIKGKYVALCEGDDYWTDPLKLQKQYDAMESHPNVDICAHAALRVNAGTGKVLEKVSPSSENTIFTVEEVIYGGGGFVATASLFIKAEYYSPACEFRRFLNLDYTLQIHGALRGGMLFLSDCMSVYRFMTVGSWSSRMSVDREKRDRHFSKVKKMLEIFNEETNFEYNDVINKTLGRFNFRETLRDLDYKKSLSLENKPFFKELSFTDRFKIRLKAYFPLLITLKNKFRK